VANSATNEPQRGQQQDAEEFLNKLLEELHEESVLIVRKSATSDTVSTSSTPSNTPSSPVLGPKENDVSGGWLEVGKKQKAAITRSVGNIEIESPITKIFGGKLRSELRIQGEKNSVTFEPYQPLQLDIGSPQVHNIVDALQGLTRSETVHGEFNSSRGHTSAVKQVFIETLPPVLILHLKRFQYDKTGGTQKIWKKVGYPLELSLPKEVFPPHKRAGLTVHGGLPKYRLIGVVYHHGKNASGGHYTVDVRRQDGREWIRIDDTMIKRVRSEDVAEGGSEEDPRVLAAALESHYGDNSVKNRYSHAGLEDEGDVTEDSAWKKVNGGTGVTGKKGWAAVAGASNVPTSGGLKSVSSASTPKSSIKDNKVAYMLFYQKINA
jgi:ubiquitin carboxyl-terminal hydrolase 10